MTSVLSWLVIGLVAGSLARFATRSKKRGCLATTVIGILGALIGGFLFQLAGQGGLNDFSLWSLLVSFVGASVLLWVVDR